MFSVFIKDRQCIRGTVSRLLTVSKLIQKDSLPRFKSTMELCLERYGK